MRRPSCKERREIERTLVSVVWFLGAALVTAPVKADVPLQLEVMVNGRPSGLIGSFVQDAKGKLSAQGKELEALHLKAPEQFKPDDEVPLSALPGVSYRYDVAKQTVDIAVPEAGLLPKAYDLRGGPKPLSLSPSATGAALNYYLLGGGGSSVNAADWQAQGLSATLDARLFSPFGVLEQTGILATNTGNSGIADDLRLDTTWTYKDPDNAVTYRAGDTITGGFAWTRPIRLGGLQVQRDFSIRPDLVTLPLPSFTGSAAVPSTADVYVNGVKTVSQDVDSGPFRLDNLPILTGQGDASVVVRDSSGRQVSTSLPFSVSNDLLRAGLWDFPVESGFPRLYYGVRSDDYSSDPAGSASVRYGLSDRLTLESHAEATKNLANVGFGGTAGLGGIGVFSAALAGSAGGGATGGLGYLSFDTSLLGFSLSASTIRTVGNYNDLASVTARPIGAFPATAPSQSASAQAWLLQSALSPLGPPKIQDQLSVSAPLPKVGGSLSLGVVRQEDPFSNSVRLATVSYSRELFNRATVSATAFAGVDGRRNAGVSLSLSIPLGGGVTASSGAYRDSSGLVVASDVSKPLGEQPGSFGWRLSDQEGEASLRQASIAYRSNYGEIDATALQSNGNFAGTVGVQGAIVAAGGAVAFANRVDDAFAVVDAGAPGVEVYRENRPVAVTDSSGKAVVPLNAYQPNKISIDPRELPLDASIATTLDVLVPRDHGGVLADFGIRTGVRSAIVILNGPDSKPLRAGLRGKTASGRDFAVGYDGRAYIEGLDSQNAITVAVEGGECHAEFSYAPRADGQTVIGPLVCR